MSDGTNVYLYAGNNPGNRLDPSGKGWYYWCHETVESGYCYDPDYGCWEYLLIWAIEQGFLAFDCALCVSCLIAGGAIIAGSGIVLIALVLPYCALAGGCLSCILAIMIASQHNALGNPPCNPCPGGWGGRMITICELLFAGRFWKWQGCTNSLYCTRLSK